MTKNIQSLLFKKSLVHLCSLFSPVFTCVHSCSLVFTRVHSCSLVFTCVHLCSLVFICVVFVFTCVHLCSFVFICVPLVWCFRLDRKQTVAALADFLSIWSERCSFFIKSYDPSENQRNSCQVF